MSTERKHTVSKRAHHVWRKFSDWYGADTIAKHFGVLPPREWCEVIDMQIRTREHLERVLADVRAQHPNYPPRFPQFEQIVDRMTMPADASEGGPSIAEQLVDYVLAHKPLTRMQRAQPWTFYGRRFDAPDAAGKIRRNHGVEIVGVIVPPDPEAGAPGYRVTVEDMQLAQAAA